MRSGDADSDTETVKYEVWYITDLRLCAETGNTGSHDLRQALGFRLFRGCNKCLSDAMFFSENMKVK
jgi:hypothetical protein